MTPRKQLPAFVLPSVLVLSTIILLIILSGYSAMTLQMQEYAAYHEYRQKRLDIRSALALICRDSMICPANDSASVRLFSGHDIKLYVSKWGLYESVEIAAGDMSKHFLLGKENECRYKAALWTCDLKRPLSLSGDTRIQGLAYIPAGGINYSDALTDYRPEQDIGITDLRLSGNQLPPTDATVSRQLRMLMDISDNTGTGIDIDESYHSFSKPTAIIMTSDIKGTYMGNLILTGDHIEFHKEATVSDIIVSANTVRIKTGFKGRAQIFCSDSVIVEAGAKLEYPSGIYMENTNPYIEIRTGSSVYGYIVVKDNDVSSRQICYVQKPGTSIKGLLYVDGICDLKGHISGAAYIKDCFHRDRDYLYSKTLHDVHIERNDSIAYPILLSGTYTRKPIKNLH